MVIIFYVSVVPLWQMRPQANLSLKLVRETILGVAKGICREWGLKPRQTSFITGSSEETPPPRRYQGKQLGRISKKQANFDMHIAL